jgi:hypothetical protein
VLLDDESAAENDEERDRIVAERWRTAAGGGVREIAAGDSDHDGDRCRCH